MRQSKLTLIILLGCILMLSFTFDNDKHSEVISNFQTLDSKKLDGNNISAWFRNNGSFNRNPVTNNSGFEVTTLVNKIQNAGSYIVKFDGTDLPSGVYFYELEADKFTETKRMVLTK